jgi:hypothetical protein
MNKLARLALSGLVLSLALLSTPQPARAACSLTEVVAIDEGRCAQACQGCRYSYDEFEGCFCF